MVVVFFFFITQILCIIIFIVCYYALFFFGKGGFCEEEEVEAEAQLLDEIVDIIRRETEPCNCPHAFQLTQSIGGGIGLFKIRDNYADSTYGYSRYRRRRTRFRSETPPRNLATGGRGDDKSNAFVVVVFFFLYFYAQLHFFCCVIFFLFLQTEIIDLLRRKRKKSRCNQGMI